MPFADEEKDIRLPLCYRLIKDLGGLLSFVQENDYLVFTVTILQEEKNGIKHPACKLQQSTQAFHCNADFLD